MMRLGWAALIVCCFGASVSRAQDRSLTSVAHGATPQERLLMEQIDQLASSGQMVEALSNLRRLVDNSQGRLVELGSIARAATLSVQIHVPISHWAHERLHGWSQTSAHEIAQTLASEAEQAERALSTVGLDTQALQEIVEDFPLAPACAPARLKLCDLYMDRGWTSAARQALDVPGLAWRATPPGSTKGDELPWRHAWPHLQSQANVSELLDATWQSIQADIDGRPDRLHYELLHRAMILTAMDGTSAELTTTTEWAAIMARRLRQEWKADFDKSLAQAAELHRQRQERAKSLAQVTTTFAGSALRSGESSSRQGLNTPPSWPKWTRQIERMTGAADRNPASKPPVAENSLSLLPYHPLVHDGRIYVHELTRVMAYDLKSGKSWPTTEPPLPLFDSGLTAASYLPFGYQFMGSPRGTLTIADDVLYARMGPPITGWFGRSPGNENRSLSYVIALDLKRQGSMRPGFPVYLPGDDYPNSEFEGAPVVSGNQIFVCVSTRDNVNLRRSVVAIDSRSGRLLWRSPPIAAGMVSGSEQFSLIAHQLVTVAGGRLFINSNLGSIACLDQATGQIVWLARYRRSSPQAEDAYPKPDRYRYRDLTPCMVIGSQVICAPQDCPEIFSLDISGGELLWSTDGEQVDDATQLLGIAGQSLIVSGDRIYWLDCSSGKVQAAFPAGSVGEVSNALPAPRGYGRGTLGGNQVYWPAANEIFVFDAEQSNQPASKVPAIRSRIRLDTRGSEGGNLVLTEDGLVVAGASRLFVY